MSRSRKRKRVRKENLDPVSLDPSHYDGILNVIRPCKERLSCFPSEGIKESEKVEQRFSEVEEDRKLIKRLELWYSQMRKKKKSEVESVFLSFDEDFASLLMRVVKSSKKKEIESVNFNVILKYLEFGCLHLTTLITDNFDDMETVSRNSVKNMMESRFLNPVFMLLDSLKFFFQNVTNSKEKKGVKSLINDTMNLLEELTNIMNSKKVFFPFWEKISLKIFQSFFQCFSDLFVPSSSTKAKKRSEKKELKKFKEKVEEKIIKNLLSVYYKKEHDKLYHFHCDICKKILDFLRIYENNTFDTLIFNFLKGLKEKSEVSSCSKLIFIFVKLIEIDFSRNISTSNVPKQEGGKKVSRSSQSSQNILIVYLTLLSKLQKIFPKIAGLFFVKKTAPLFFQSDLKIKAIVMRNYVSLIIGSIMLDSNFDENFVFRFFVKFLDNSPKSICKKDCFLRKKVIEGIIQYQNFNLWKSNDATFEKLFGNVSQILFSPRFEGEVKFNKILLIKLWFGMILKNPFRPLFSVKGGLKGGLRFANVEKIGREIGRIKGLVDILVKCEDIFEKNPENLKVLRKSFFMSQNQPIIEQSERVFCSIPFLQYFQELILSHDSVKFDQLELSAVSTENVSDNEVYVIKNFFMVENGKERMMEIGRKFEFFFHFLKNFYALYINSIYKIMSRIISSTVNESSAEGNKKSNKKSINNQVDREIILVVSKYFFPTSDMEKEESSMLNSIDFDIKTFLNWINFDVVKRNLPDYVMVFLSKFLCKKLFPKSFSLNQSMELFLGILRKREKNFDLIRKIVYFFIKENKKGEDEEDDDDGENEVYVKKFERFLVKLIGGLGKAMSIIYLKGILIFSDIFPAIIRLKFQSIYQYLERELLNKSFKFHKSSQKRQIDLIFKIFYKTFKNSEKVELKRQNSIFRTLVGLIQENFWKFFNENNYQILVKLISLYPSEYESHYELYSVLKNFEEKIFSDEGVVISQNSIFRFFLVASQILLQIKKKWVDQFSKKREIDGIERNIENGEEEEYMDENNKKNLDASYRDRYISLMISDGFFNRYLVLVNEIISTSINKDIILFGALVLKGIFMTISKTICEENYEWFVEKTENVLKQSKSIKIKSLFLVIMIDILKILPNKADKKITSILLKHLKRRKGGSEEFRFLSLKIFGNLILSKIIKQNLVFKLSPLVIDENQKIQSFSMNILKIFFRNNIKNVNQVLYNMVVVHDWSVEESVRIFKKIYKNILWEERGIGYNFPKIELFFVKCFTANPSEKLSHFLTLFQSTQTSQKINAKEVLVDFIKNNCFKKIFIKVLEVENEGEQGGDISVIKDNIESYLKGFCGKEILEKVNNDYLFVKRKILEEKTEEMDVDERKDEGEKLKESGEKEMMRKFMMYSQKGEINADKLVIDLTDEEDDDDEDDEHFFQEE